MDNFNLYAKYYDLLYQDKDYEADVEYILSLITRNASLVSKQILDLGCGTGTHAAIFSDKGYCVDGVDISSQMISRAKVNFGANPKLNFSEGDITSFNVKKEYDIVTSLFHVMSYQNSNDAILSSFQTASKHLKKDGLFIFDFWYGPGVLTNPPVIREKKLENDEIKVKRIATPIMHNERNVVDVNYEIDILNKLTGSAETISEKHSMRYLFKPEIEFYLQKSRLKLMGFYQWLTLDTPTMDSWNVVAIAKKI
jgi:SAM-dependent methyltransferase